VNPRRIPIAIFILLAVIFGFSIAAASENPISFAGDRDFPPVEYLEKDVPKGLNVDLLRELSKAMGRKIDIRLMPWEEAQQKVLSGEIDAITTMSITEERKQLYDFSEITLTYQYSLFLKTGQVGIQTAQDLKGKAVAVTKGGLPRQVLQSVPGIKLVFIEDYLEGFRLLLSEEIDAVAADRWVGAYTLQKNGIRGITIIDKPFAEKHAGIAVKRGNTELLNEINLGIRKLISDGTIKRIEAKWSPKEILFLTREQIYEKAVYVIVTLLIVVIGVAFFWILSLRKANNSLRESRRVALNLKDDRLAAEQALNAANKRNLTILESITDGFLALDKEWRYTYFNETGARMIGMKRDDLIGGCVWELFPHATSTRFFGEYHRAVETGTPVHFEEYYPDPLNLWLECHCYPIPEGLTVFFRDISERKQAEQALQRAHGLLAGIALGTQDLIAAQDKDYRYLFFNDAYGQEFKRLWGQDIEVGTSMIEAMAQWPEDLRRAKDLWGRALSGESFSVTTEFGSSQRTTQAYDLRFSPIHDAQGRQIGAAHILRNVTEKVIAQKALQQLNETLEAQVAERTEVAQARSRQLQGLAIELIETEERERRQFAELLHEDLQQMLASARFQLQAVNKDLPTEPMLANVIQILEESIAKSRSLSHELSPPVLHHGDLYAALVWLTGQVRKQFGLVVQLEADKPPQIENGPLKVFVFRAVKEFLFNTVKHAGVKSARIELSGLNGNFQVTVSDEGHGFDKNILDSDKAKTGFGLIAIRERAHHMGGRLKIESMPGQGARLSLMVPINFVPKNDSHHPVERPLDVIKQIVFPDNEGFRVLFADDHKVMRQGLIRLISGQPGIQVVGEAANGQEALELTRKLKPNVVVMDINMPEMDGIEATRFIKTELPEVRVIGLSMHEDENIYRTMLDAGADAFVVKTASSAELLKAIYGSK
jgi:PAS domain S-box-containing protein